MSEQKIVLPGDKVSTLEELTPGEGTFEEDGIIRANRVGLYQADKKNKKALVKPLSNIPTELKKGDIILARVDSVRSSMVTATAFHVRGKKRSISGDTNATLRVAEISKGYVKDPATEYAPGDIIRAKVIQVDPNIQLATKDRDLGVIKAVCSKCRQPLKLKGNILECENCRNREKRNITDDYGNYDLDRL